jgi:hypothetical protein
VKRSTWIAVLLTAGVLVLAGQLPRLPWEGALASWRGGLERVTTQQVAQQVAQWPHLARRVIADAGHAAPRLALPASSVRLRVPLVHVAPPMLLATPAAARPRGAWRLQLPPQVALPAAAGALVGTLAALALVLSLRRDRRGMVWQMARRGQSPARIARRTRVPQDAVRTLLTPGLGARR